MVDVLLASSFNEKIYQAFRKKSSEAGVFGHGYTYAGHPVSAAVALETLKIYEERDIVGHVRRIAPVLQTGLRQFLDHDLVGEVRGVGLISGVELMANRDQAVSFKASDQVGPTTQTLAQKHGLIIRAMGDTIAFCPPLVINEDDICELLQRFGKTLDAVRDWAHRQSLI